MPTVYKYQDSFADRLGRPVPNVAVTVKNHGGGAATLWNESGTVEEADNIVTSDSNGRFFFYAPMGRYDLETVYGTVSDVIIYGVVEYSDAALIEAGLGPSMTLTEESTLDDTQGIVYLATPADANPMLFHLPVYNAVTSRKRYQLENTGEGLARIDTTDSKTIDDAAYVDLLPGDRCVIAKYNGNWLVSN